MRVADLIMAEWKFLASSKRLLALVLLVPLLFAFLFGSTYSQGKIRDLPLIIMDEDRSKLSRQILQAFDGSESFAVVDESGSEDALIKRIKSGEAAVGVIIPGDFEKTVTRGDRGELMTVVDGSNIMVVNHALNAANEIVQTFSGGIALKRMEAKGLTEDTVFSLSFAYRMLYNPGLSYSIFIPLGLMAAIVQQVLLIAIACSIARYKDQGKGNDPLPSGSWGKWLYAKAVPYFLLGVFQVMATMGILIKQFDYPFLGHTGFMILLTILFICSLIGLGMLLSAVSPNTLQATQISMLLAVLSFPLSGYTWPFLAMPKELTMIGHIFPLTYFLDGLQKIAIKGSGWEQLQHDLAGLLIITVVTLAATALVLIRQRKKAGNTGAMGSLM